MRVTIKCLLLALCIGFGAIGPAYAEELEFIGNSRIEMSDWLKKQWDKYQNAFNKGTLLIKFDEGKVWISHWACHSGHTSSDCLSENRSQMMYRVRMRSKKWQIFAEQGKIVWKGPVCYQRQNLSKFGDCNSYNSSNNNSSSSSSNSSDSNNAYIKKIADKALCLSATDANGNWEQEYAYKIFVDEAKSRSLSLDRCSELSGRPNPSELRKFDNTQLCNLATRGDELSWQTSGIMQRYVDEAKRRSLTISKCSELTGRPNPEASPPQSSSAKSVGKELDSIEVRLEKLKKLEDAGLITSEEAAEKRKEILRDM